LPSGAWSCQTCPMIKAAAKGAFITFEGGEGSGKSTQTALLADRLRLRSLDVVVTREPGGSPYAEQIRDVLLAPKATQPGALTDTLLFNAARADHLDVTIRPALAAGHWVICDRFADSTRAYQGAASGLDATTLATLQSLVVGPTTPDLTLLIDLDPAVGLTRASQRRSVAASGTPLVADSFEGRDMQFHQRLRQGFLDIARAEPQRVVVLDGFQNQLMLADAVFRAVTERLQLPNVAAR
jgi:dTMP kinase